MTRAGRGRIEASRTTRSRGCWILTGRTTVVGHPLRVVVKCPDLCSSVRSPELPGVVVDSIRSDEWIDVLQVH